MDIEMDRDSSKESLVFKNEEPLNILGLLFDM